MLKVVAALLLLIAPFNMRISILGSTEGSRLVL